MLRILKQLYLNSIFFYAITLLVILFCVSFFIPKIFLICIYATIGLAALTLIDGLWLFIQRILIQANRITPTLFSLSDENKVELILRNLSNRQWHLEIVDELPEQFQKRDFKIKKRIDSLGNLSCHYHLRPLQRGEYHFGQLNIFVMSHLRLVRRRIRIPIEQMVPVYPSIIQMKNFELYTLSKISTVHGIKKMRRVGLSYEFEQIKNYVRGDDVRQINWKASGKHQSLMINQFEDERSQPIYSIIDKSRIMLMPFNGLSLMDYAINASLVISNVALKKRDKAGLITYSDKIGAAIKADNKHGQLQLILNKLYNQKERDFEANYELLYYGIKNMIKTRSLLFLYTNFESIFGLQRVMPILRSINKQHLLVVVFFENSELEKVSSQPIKDLKGIYTNILAAQALNEKKIIAQELNNVGIQTILTKPEDLSINSINKYLEIKARGLI